MKYLYAWLIIGQILFHAYCIYGGIYTWLYSDLLFLTMLGIRSLWRRHLLPSFFYSTAWVQKYFVTAYAMVLIEEVLAGLINNSNEGFSFSLFLYRITQFWAFNLFAFSGIIIGMFFLFRARLMNKKELIVFASLFGLYAEHIVPNIITSPVVFLAYAPIVLAVYYVIFKPGIMFLPDTIEVRNNNKLIRYILSCIVVYIFSLPFILTLSYLRLHYSDIFPPCEMIPCS